MKSSTRRSPSLVPATGMALALALAALPVLAQQYRWVDQKGRVQYTDTPPPATAKDVQKKHFDAGKTDGPAEPFALQMARKAAPIKLYTAPECPDCDSARKYLNKRGIPFSEVSVVLDSQAAELRKLTGRVTVPVLMIGTSMQRGFDESAYENEINLAGYPKSLPERHQSAPPAPKPPAAPGAPQPAAPAAPTK